MKKVHILLAGFAIIVLLLGITAINQPHDSTNRTEQFSHAEEAQKVATDSHTPSTYTSAPAEVNTSYPTTEPNLGTTYELEVENAMITLTLPSEYEMLPLEWRETHSLPERYEFMNPATSITFGLQTDSDNQKNQDILLSKLHDPANKFTSFSLTCNTYQTWAYFHYDNREHGFYVIADNGYAYNFYLYLPEDQGQNSPPEEALKILETLQIKPK